MKERPILFSGPMVRALLDGLKAQTRRVVKRPADCPPDYVLKPEALFTPGVTWWQHPEHDRVGRSQVCPYGAPGDRLWVRETWGLNHYEYASAPIPKTRPADLGDQYLVYFATEDDCEINAELRRRPSIHMPRWASRITLEITGVRVERLKACSREDAIAEGLIRTTFNGETAWISPADERDGRCFEFAQDAYRDLWEHINGAGSWDANPWVWVVDFQRSQP